MNPVRVEMMEAQEEVSPGKLTTVQEGGSSLVTPVNQLKHPNEMLIQANVTQ
jgi:hypothetical protein